MKPTACGTSAVAPTLSHAVTSPTTSAPPLMKLNSSIPPNFSASEMTEKEKIFDERIRTAGIFIIAVAVIYGAMYVLRGVMIPFLIAIALKYLLTPLIDCLSCRGRPGCFGCCKLPHGIAVLLAFLVAVLLLIALAGVIVSSATSFADHAELYRSRLETLLEEAVVLYSKLQGEMGERRKVSLEEAQEQAIALLKTFSITDLIVHGLGTAAHVAENLMYVVLFLVFMIAHAPPENEHVDGMSRSVDKQIFVYIRGKSAIAALVACTNGAILATIGLDLWMAFGVLSFFLNFIPNVGMFSAILLPMPLIALDPTFTPWQIAFAFLGPLLVGSFAKDVLEPIGVCWPPRNALMTSLWRRFLSRLDPQPKKTLPMSSSM